MISRYVIPVLSFSLIPALPTYSSEFTVDQLSLITGIVFGGQSAGDGTSMIQNPTVDHFEASLGGSATTMDVNLAWNEEAGLARFLIESTLAGEGTPSGGPLLSANSTSRIWITPSVPLTVILHGEYTFDLPGDQMRTVFEFLALGDATHEVAFFERHGYDTIVGPGADTFTIDAEFLLPPTDTWLLRAIMDIDMFPGSTPFTGSGSGFFDIRIVPEPTTLAFCTTLMLLFRRSHRVSA